VTSTGRALRIFVVAGEESGDQLAANLMQSLAAAHDGPIEYAGLGGERMAELGVDSLFPISEISIIGFSQVIAQLPKLLRRIRETTAAAVAFRPDLMLLVDVPGFSLRVGKAFHRVAPEVPVVDYVSPSVWAYWPWRARKMATYVDLVLAILPFEPAEHRKLGGPRCVYVDHPLIERTEGLRPAGGERVAIGEGPPRLLLLPGSRNSEIRRLLAPFGEALALLQSRVDGLEVVLPTLPRLRDAVAAGTTDWPIRPRIVVEEADKLAAFRTAHAALAASGTVSLELALAGVPTVIAYRTDPVLKRLKWMIRPPSIVLANLVLGENAVPEFIDEESSPEALADAVAPLLEHSPQREAQLQAMARLDELMVLEGDETPSSRAAAHVLSLATRDRSQPA